MDARLATALSHAAHDILSSNSTIKSLATQLNGIEASKVILDASSRIHRLADQLQRFANANKALKNAPKTAAELHVSVACSELAAMIAHRFGIACDTAENLAGASIHPGRFRQVLEILGSLIEGARTRVNALKLTPEESKGGSSGVKLVMRLENGGQIEDSIALLLCEALMESMGGTLTRHEEKIELSIPKNAR